jgi:DNA-binding CsgD family transcriptional regulator
MNTRAQRLFGHTFLEWSGKPCHACVRGRTQDGAFCCPRCRVRQEADAGREIGPIRMRVASTLERGYVNIVVIAVDDAAGPLLVHCVLDDERERRLQRFLAGVMHRNERTGAAWVSRDAALTRREQEILSLIAADRSLHQIADELSISYATVRNHVQHILPKLGVHSILEAAAVWMLRDERR